MAYQTLGFLTAPHLSALTPDDQRVLSYLEAMGIAVRPVLWPDPRWNQTPEALLSGYLSGLDALVMRSCWTYHQMPEAFEAWTHQLDALALRHHLPTHNKPAIFRANMDKRYLLHVQSQGHPVVPTHIVNTARLKTLSQRQACEMLERSSPSSVLQNPLQHSLQTLVLKPVVSASGENTHLWPAETPLPLAEAIGSDAERLWMVQPLVESITTHGEYSLIFFKGHLSHGVRKRPVTHAFLVHEEHGGMTEAHVPPADLLAVAQTLLHAPLWQETLAQQLYARLDFVWYKAQWCLMEVELIEPSLYLAYDPQAPARWARCLAFDTYGGHRRIMEQLEAADAKKTRM